MNTLLHNFRIKIVFLFFIVGAFINAVSAQTTLNESYVFGGISRDYHVYVPGIYSSQNAVPLVINLHGYTSNNLQQEAYADFRPIADTANFILVHPNGTFDQSLNRYWNFFGLPLADDIGFLSSLIDTIRTHYNIDTNRIYFTGFSNGGFMSFELACKLSHRVAAIASVAGGMISAQQTNCTPIHPMPVMYIHGTADATVSFNGIGGIIASLPVDSLMLYWVQKNQCNPVANVSNVPDIVSSDLSTTEHYVYENGLKGSTVEFYKILGGTHTWPGAPVNLGVTNMDFNASQEIWRFFNQYRLNNLITSVENIESFSSFEVYPNPSSGTFHFRLNQAENATMYIYTWDGKKVLESAKLSQYNQFSLPAGNYLVEVVVNGVRTHKSLLIK
ncbi:MAG TPA: PHB depolymerase family esterase [Chitinophagaceae bacterium]|nr:PHB depolymerase family esterase [Chitinophagaceae bacterium]